MISFTEIFCIWLEIFSHRDETCAVLPSLICLKKLKVHSKWFHVCKYFCYKLIFSLCSVTCSALYSTGSFSIIPHETCFNNRLAALSAQPLEQLTSQKHESDQSKTSLPSSPPCVRRRGSIPELRMEWLFNTDMSTYIIHSLFSFRNVHILCVVFVIVNSCTVRLQILARGKPQTSIHIQKFNQ